uniref:ODAD1 central coiled coil region domain-containing protein n=1 Tax=Strigamia maritima TaxID=126957 RepID=T1J6H2_STRMM
MSAGADTELEQDALLDLTKLQRQYRIMENDKKAYIAETFNLIEKQHKLIKELEQEKINLDSSLDISRSNQYLSKDVDNFLKLKDLLTQKDEYNEFIKSERSKLKLLLKEEKQVQKQLDEEWKRLGGKKSYQERNLTLAAKCKRTENILDHAMKEYNRFLAANQRLRADIKNLLTVRRQFNLLHGKLSQYLDVTKNEMTQTIALTTQAFDQRDDCQTKMQTLRDRWEKDDAQYQQELRDLQRTLAHDQNLTTFLTHKSEERPILMGKKTAQGAGRDYENNVEFYRKAFNKIAALTGEENIEALVERILRTEEENFALFNYVNELNREIEEYQASIQKLRNEIMELKSNGQERELNRQEEIRLLETELESQTQEMDKAEENLRNSRKAFEGLIDGIQNMFDTTKSKELVDEGLLEDGYINERNVMAFLSAIEQRATQLTLINEYLVAKARESPKSMRPLSVSTEAPKLDYNIATPSITFEGDSEEEEGVLKPMTRHEIKDIVDKERRITKSTVKLVPKIKDGGAKKKTNRI